MWVVTLLVLDEALLTIAVNKDKKGTKMCFEM